MTRRLFLLIPITALTAVSPSRSLQASRDLGRLPMNNDDVSLDELQEAIQNHFDCLDRSFKDIVPRDLPVITLPILDRNLYFVHDVIAITNNAGMGAWIHYHIDDRGWIDDAARAFRAIGHADVACAIEACAVLFRAKNGAMADDDDTQFSRMIWDQEAKMYRSLYDHLKRNGFAFRNRDSL